MSKFANEGATPRGGIVTKTPARPGVTPQPDALTHEGGAGFERTPEGELFLLGASYLYGKPTFYERPDQRDQRFLALLGQVDPTWLAGFIPYLRRNLNIRTAAVVAAAEYIRMGHPNGRAVVRGALARADEPAELLGYWLSRHGRKLPMALKRGLADALVRLGTEYNVLKYAGWGNRVSFADVIQFAHPAPRDGTQRTLFQYLLAKRRGVPGAQPQPGPMTPLAIGPRDYGLLPMHAARADLLDRGIEQRREAVLTSPGLLADAGATWEWVASTLLPGGMGSAEWSAVVPQMGVMALLRNLRNFEHTGLSVEATSAVLAKLTGAEDVRRSRALPLRFLQAHAATARTTWGSALEAGLRLATANVPELAGKTVALADVSGSMVWGRGGAAPWPTAVAFAMIAADRSAPGSTFTVYSDSAQDMPVGDVIPALDRVKASRPFGGGTRTVEAIVEAYRRTPDARRIVVVTDEQAFATSGMYWQRLTEIPVPIYTWNVQGYRTGHLPSGSANRYSFGGLSDAAFTLLAAIEDARDVGWPWEQ